MNKQLTLLLFIGLAWGQSKVNINNLKQYGDRWVKENDDKPFTGIVFNLSKQTGKKILNYQMNKGLKHGLFEEYFEDGLLKSKGTYIDGLKDGVWEETEFLESKNLKIEKKGRYKKDLMDGNWITDIYPKDSLILGTLFCFYNSDEPYKDTLVNKYLKWLKFELNVNLTGLRKYELKFNNLTSAKGEFQNELFSDERYWKNGQKAYEKTYRNGIKNGKWIEWFENGQKAYEKTYKEGKEDGLRISWNENGDKVYEEKIIDGIVSELVFINVKNFNTHLDSAEIPEYILNKSESLRKNNFTGAAVSRLIYVLKNFSDHKIASRAQYMLGDLYMNDLRNFSRAIEEYRKVIEKYSGSEQEPDALFMIGYIYANVLDDKNSAVSAYQSFIQQFPNHKYFSSVKFELEYLGKTVDEIPALKYITTD